MPSARLTLKVSGIDGVIANLRQYTAEARTRVRAVVDAHRLIVHGLARDLCAFDTGWMAAHTSSELTEQGYGFRVGYRPSDFIGQLNTFAIPPRTIADFYPKYVITGTRRTPAQDNLTPAIEFDRQGFYDDVRAALVPR